MVRRPMLTAQRLATSLMILLAVPVSTLSQGQPSNDPNFDPAVFKSRQPDTAAMRCGVSISSR